MGRILYIPVPEQSFEDMRSNEAAATSKKYLHDAMNFRFPCSF